MPIWCLTCQHVDKWCQKPSQPCRHDGQKHPNTTLQNDCSIVWAMRLTLWWEWTRDEPIWTRNKSCATQPPSPSPFITNSNCCLKKKVSFEIYFNVSHECMLMLFRYVGYSSPRIMTVTFGLLNQDGVKWGSGETSETVTPLLDLTPLCVPRQPNS